LDRRRFVPQVDYVTSPGYIDSPAGRQSAGLKGGGPVSVITDRAVFKFDEDMKEMYLSGIYPGVQVQDITKEVGWKLNIASHVETVDPPTSDEVDYIRNYDPTDVILRKKRIFETLDFASWALLTREHMQRGIRKAR